MVIVNSDDDDNGDEDHLKSKASTAAPQLSFNEFTIQL